MAAVIAMVALAPSVPGTAVGAADRAPYAFAPRVFAGLGLCFVVFASLYSALTYTAPFLVRVTGITARRSRVLVCL